MAGIRSALRELWSAPDDARMIEQAGHWHSWSEVRGLAEQITAELDRIGAGPGSRIGVVLSNSMQSVASLVAILGTGRTLVTLNPMQPAARVARDLLGSAPDVALAPTESWSADEFRSAVDELGIPGFSFAQAGAGPHRTLRDASPSGSAPQGSRSVSSSGASAPRGSGSVSSSGGVGPGGSGSVSSSGGVGPRGSSCTARPHFLIPEADATKERGSRRVRRDEAPDSTTTAASGTAIEMFTSGTTGAPKRIPLTWRQLDSTLAAVHSRIAQPEQRPAPLTGRVALVTLSMVHIGGMWAVLQALSEARPFVLLERFTVDGWTSAIEEHQPRIASLPPAAMRSVLNADVPAERLRSLRAVTAGTTFVSPDLADEFIGRYGIPVLIVYGATEFSGAVAGWTKPMHHEWWTRKRGSVGRPFPGVSMRTVDDAGNILPTGETGRLEVLSGQTTSGADGWVRTSDLAHLDEDGFLYIGGRADDAIVRGGFKVQPEVVADALRAHEAILDATVYGRADDRLGQVPVAVVEWAPGAAPVGEADLKECLRARLTAYEIPVTIHGVDKLPRSASLKVDRRRLLDLVADIEAAQENQE
nr:AMP-binding protein [Gordonia amarae]